MSKEKKMAEKKEVLGARTEEVVVGVYKKLKAMGDIFMAVDQQSQLDILGETIWQVGYDLFGMGQKLEALVTGEDPDLDDLDD